MPLSSAVLPSLILETNIHTFEKRIYTSQSIVEKFKALGIPIERLQGKKNFSTKHAVYTRLASNQRETEITPMAKADGSWGWTTPREKCGKCDGVGTLKVKDEVSQETIRCYRCLGTGKVMTRAEKRRSESRTI